MTTQRAFERLQAEGFVAARGKAGTFVTERPPPLYNYAMVFPRAPGTTANHESWPRFWEALCYEAAAVERTQPRKVELFYDINADDDSQTNQTDCQASTGTGAVGAPLVGDACLVISAANVYEISVGGCDNGLGRRM